MTSQQDESSLGPVVAAKIKAFHEEVAAIEKKYQDFFDKTEAAYPANDTSSPVTLQQYLVEQYNAYGANLSFQTGLPTYIALEVRDAFMRIMNS